MIVVVGSPIALETASGITAGGLASHVAAALAYAGERVELVGRVGSDAAADSLIVALGRAGIGHVALLRDHAHETPRAAEGTEAPPGIPIDSGDLQLALSYLTAFDAAILIAVGLDTAAANALVVGMEEGAAFTGARLFVVGDRLPHGGAAARSAGGGVSTPTTEHIVRGDLPDAEFAAALVAQVRA